MKDFSVSKRKCSALLAAGAGAAVCLTGGGQAAVITGNITATNPGGTVFNMYPGANAYPHAFNAPGGVAVWWKLRNSGGRIMFSWYDGFPRLNATGGVNGYAAVHAAGVDINSLMANDFALSRKLPSNVSDAYFAVKFRANLTNPNAYYGWIHVVSSNATGTQLRMDTWGYEDVANTSIQTLADSMKTHRLDLSDGRVKLHWTNANEDGVARYEVQTQDALGAWQAVSSETPGAGAYSATVPAGGASRVVIEKVDGTSEEAGF